MYLKTLAIGGIQQERPMTLQGVGGPKTGMPGKLKTNMALLNLNLIGSGRMVQDKTYFMNELRQKINMLTSEINRLNIEADQIQKDNDNYLTFEKRYF